MSILQALDRYYDRMAERGEAEAPGWSREKISFSVRLSLEGEPVGITDLREQSGRRLIPRLLEVPAAVIRKSNILPNFLWDKTAYSLGCTAGEGRRTAEEHEAFKVLHLELLAGTEDEGLRALRRFLEHWTPDRFDVGPFIGEMLDANIVFQLDHENPYLHQREAGRQLVAARAGEGGVQAICLVTGKAASIQRLHPPIKGVEGAQSSGAALVSFNLDAFTSYGKVQGDNAPTSEAAAFRYGAALNRMLDRTPGANRLPRPIGDATVVFWADASQARLLPEQREAAATAADEIFGAMFNPPTEADELRIEKDAGHARRVGDILREVSDGRPLRDIDARLDDGVRFHVLGLSPNAARLSVRYWLEDRFEVFARRLADHHDDLAIQPLPWKREPSIQMLLVKTVAAQEKFDNIPPMLAGEMTRAVLTGAPYPHSLLAAVLMRIRAGDDPSTGWHAAAIRAVLARRRRRNFPTERSWLMSLQEDFADPAYQLGRMFAALETAQRLALGKVNATIRDRYFGAASATPATVFPLLLRGAQSHLGKVRKDGKGGWIEKVIEDIADRLPPALPAHLRLEDQGRFVIGYYHQRKAQFTGRSAGETGDEGETNGNDH